MGKILQLPDTLITKIAAGQVIERPAYAVKELLENALDAGAQNITIEYRGGGSELIRVTDDGVGMEKEDLRNSFLRHTTSKIREETDLHQITTFGFRGEALASIASLSTCTIQSKDKDSTTGTRVVIKHGDVEEMSSVGMTTGTQVKIEDLFESTPARKKVLKSPQTEARHILDVITRAALANNHVSFHVLRDGRKPLILPRRETSEERLRDLLGGEFGEKALPVFREHPYVTVRGWISHPHSPVPSSGGQYLFVNSRPTQDASINAVVKKTYGTLLDPRRFPGFVLFLTMPYDTVDVNIHPRKNHVRFHHSTTVLETVAEAVEQALEKNNLTFFDKRWGNNKTQYKPLEEMVSEPFLAREGGTQTYAGKKLKQDVTPWRVKPTPQGRETNVLQVDNTYLVFSTPGKEGITIIDQHAAHERILYEQFLQEYQNKTGKDKSHRLEKAVLVKLSPSHAELLHERRDDFTTLGFDLEDFGDSTVKVNAVPSLLQDRDVRQLLFDILKDLEDNLPTQTIDTNTFRMLSYLACRSAIKAGDPLTQDECLNLVEKLENTDKNYTCPHGRPVMVTISVRELETMFKRR